MDALKPSELTTAARVADGLVYVAGLAGVAAGALLFRDGDVAFAVIAWAVTFIAGTVLRLAAWMARGIARVMERSERIEADVARLVRQQVAEERQDPEDRFRPWH